MPFGETRTVQMSIVFAIFFASAMIVRIGGFPIDRDKTEGLSDLRLVGQE